MNWKNNLQLSDLEADARLEILCSCGKAHYAAVRELLKRGEDMRYKYLDELEKELKCADRRCKGRVRLALVHGKTEGFVGGMP